MSLRELAPDPYPYLDYRKATFSLGLAAGGMVWLSGATAARFDPASKGVTVEGDLVAQARLIFEKMRLTLAAADLGLGQVARLQHYVTPAALPHLDRLAALEAELFPAPPSTATVVVKRLLRDAALIEIEAVARAEGEAGLVHLPSVCGKDLATARDGVAADLEAQGLAADNVLRTLEITTPAATGSAPFWPGALTRVTAPRLVDGAADAQVEVTATRALPGTVVMVAATGDPAQGGIVDQCREVYARLLAQLGRMGVGPGQVVKTTEFITSAALAAYRGTAQVRRELFEPPFPAATGVIAEGLPVPGALIAVEMTAVRP